MKVPFTTEQFFNVFEKYNTTLFPFQIVIFLLGIATIIILHSNNSLKKKYICFFLACLWLWIGIVYHIGFFYEINKAAYLFGGIFMVQGLLFLIHAFRRDKYNFSFQPGITDYIAYFFIIFGLIIYPVIGYFIEGSPERVIALGLPCPSTIFTFGMLMLSSKLPKYLLIIPTLWSIVGLSAALNFGVYQDFIMILAAITAWLNLLRKK